ncbi:ABC transporter permease [Streptomyces odontomachi]|uniref:ABC transporter permease n=1 Tax=Streptomyces odontomachi TaxID=2944940 RepID=UPI00210891B7|nr:ABC transporter permease [Streptomyces sp. ODS25]
MRRVGALLHQIGYGLLSSYQDYRAMYTWRSWLFGWMARLLCQVLFFSMVGQAIGSAAAQDYMALGNAVILGPLGALGVVSSSVGERRGGTLQFLLLSRNGPFPVMMSRGLYWAADGIVTSCVALVLLRWMLGVEVRPVMLPVCFLLQILITLSGYCMALSLAGISLRWPESRMYLTAGATIVWMTFAGVNTAPPRTGAGDAIASVLPVTHGLRAMRAVVAGDAVPLTAVVAECGVLLLWGTVSWLALTGSLRHQIRVGTLDLR